MMATDNGHSLRKLSSLKLIKKKLRDLWHRKATVMRKRKPRNFLKLFRKSKTA